MKIASFCVPHLGGTWTVARGLREGLREHGIEVRWLGIGPAGTCAYNNPSFMEERPFGEVLAPDTTDEEAQAKALATRLIEGCFDAILIDVLAGKLQANLARYLPASLPRIMIVHNITLGTYAFAAAIRDWVHHTVTVSPRIRDDLMERYGFRKERIVCIPNAVDLSAYQDLPRQSPSSTLRVILLGRMEDASKGIFWLPQIIKSAAPARIAVTLAGDGPDLPRLKSLCDKSNLPIRYMGGVPSSKVPGLFSEHDVFLMPSRYEGLPLALIEAMAAGCVPVASRIKGVTDFIVDHEETGLLFRVGDVRCAGTILKQLEQDREMLRSISERARESVQGRFTLACQAAAYADVIKRTIQDRPGIAGTLPMDHWAYPRGIAPSWRSWLPEWLKRPLRGLRERLRS